MNTNLRYARDAAKSATAEENLTIARYQGTVDAIAFRGDAAFAQPGTPAARTRGRTSISDRRRERLCMGVATGLIGWHDIGWWQALWSALQFFVVLAALVIAAQQLRSYNYRERARATVDVIDKWHASVEVPYVRLLFDIDPVKSAASIHQRYNLYKPNGEKNGTAEANLFWSDFPRCRQLLQHRGNACGSPRH
jgi:hypothetical protein